MTKTSHTGYTIFGLPFTAEQWDACNITPPLWHLHPPQREDYHDDYAYALGEREYADRVIAYRKQWTS